MVLCGLLMLALMAWTLRQWQRTDPVIRAWREFQRKLTRRGLVAQAWEGPRDYGLRAASACPAKAGEIAEIETLFETLRYRPVQSADALRKFRYLIRVFAP